VQIDAPPRDGEANEGVIKFFAKTLGVAKSDIELKSGHKSRNKVISLPSSGGRGTVTVDDVAKRIQQQLKNE
jgi:uncharacterized protein